MTGPDADAERDRAPRGSSGPGATRPPRAPGLAWLAVALALAAWLPATFGAGFAFDDREALEHNPAVDGSLPWTGAFARDYWEHRGAAGHYRPLATLSLRLDLALWGEHGAGFHATNVLLHVLVVASAAALLARLAPRDARAPWLGLALFAVHPALADSVAWISGRSSLLAALGGLLAAVFLAREARPGARALVADFALGLAGAGFAFLGKEDGVLFALLLPCVAARRGRRAAATCAAGCVLAVAAVLALRAQALGSPWIEAPHAPLADESLPARLLVAGRALLEALRLFAFPLGHAPNYAGDPAFLPARVTAEPWPAVLGLGLYAAALACAAAALVRRRTLLTVASALALVAWAPFLQVVPAGEVFAPRFLYLPLLCAVPALGAVLAAATRALPLVEPRRARAASALAALLLALACAGAWTRGRVYASRASYREAVLDARPDDVPSWNDLGLAFEEQGRASDATAAWRRATELDPRYSRAWSNLGRVALTEGRREEALLLLERAVREGPQNPVAHLNLGSAKLASGDARGAEACYRKSLALAPGFAPARAGLERALAAQSR